MHALETIPFINRYELEEVETDLTHVGKAHAGISEDKVQHLQRMGVNGYSRRARAPTALKRDRERNFAVRGALRSVSKCTTIITFKPKSRSRVRFNAVGVCVPQTNKPR